MGRPAKAARRRARKKSKAAKQSRAWEWRRYRNQFPGFVFKDNHADPDFIELVKSLIRGMDYSDRSLFHAAEIQFLKHMKRSGFAVALNTVLQQTEEAARGTMKIGLGLLMGGKIFTLLEREGCLENWIPYHDAEILPHGNQFSVRFSSLQSASTPAGKRYFPDDKPKVKISGKDYTACFSRHAIERICTRAIGNWRGFAGAGDAYGIIAESNCFEPATVDCNGEAQPAFAVFQICCEGFVSADYVREVLGVQMSDNKFLYRVGYCPVAISGDLAGAKTMLSPGMNGTPEATLFRESSLSYGEKKRIRKGIKIAESLEKIAQTQDLSAIKWFHDNGIPQVIEAK